MCSPNFSEDLLRIKEKQACFTKGTYDVVISEDSFSHTLKTG